MFFEPQETHQERLDKLIASANGLELIYNRFKSAVAQAYKNQPERAAGEYKIQSEDFAVCESLQQEFKTAYADSNQLLTYYCVSGPFSAKEKEDLTEDYRQYAEKCMSYRNDISQEMSGSLYGIAYVYKYPTREKQQRYEHDYEYNRTMEIMGFR